MFEMGTINTRRQVIHVKCSERCLACWKQSNNKQIKVQGEEEIQEGEVQGAVRADKGSRLVVSASPCLVLRGPLTPLFFF